MKTLNLAPLNLNSVIKKISVVLEKETTLSKTRYEPQKVSQQSSDALRSLFEGELNYKKAKRIYEANKKYADYLCVGEKITGISLLQIRNTNQKVKVLISRIEKPDKNFILVRNTQDGKSCASAVLEYTGVPSFPAKSLNNYCKNAFELIRMDTDNAGKKAADYKGLGSTIINEAVKLSKEKGFGGRIYLNANNEIPPTPFYYKCGLRFPSEAKNKLMEQYLKNGEKQGNLDKLIRCGIMYLPDENIAKILKN